MDTEGIREMISLWLKDHKVKRAELAQEAGYTSQYINDIMSRRPISERTKKTLAAAMQRMEERASKDLSEIAVTLSEQDIDEIHKTAEELKLSIDAFVNMLIRKANKRPAAKDLQEAPTFAGVLPAAKITSDERYNLAIIGNIAAGGLQSGDTIPYHIKANRPLGRGEYVLRVEGRSMEPVIPDGALVVMRRHTLPPVPKAGTIVQYDDERGVTLKKLGRRKNPETGKMEYVLHPLNPVFGDIEPMDGGRISGIYVTTLENWSKA